MSNSSIDRTLSGATIQVQSRFISDGDEGALRIPQNSSIIGASPSNCLMLYPEFPSAEIQPVYSTALADLGS